MSAPWTGPFKAVGLLVAATLLTACGGGGGGDRLAAVDPTPPGSSGGIGGSGVSTSGTITGSGSIFVNGQRFAIDEAAITLDGEPADESALTLGMIVSVDGSIGDSDSDGTATRVTARTALRGPVAGLERDDDSRSLQLRVLGTLVIVEREGTVFAGTAFDSLAAGDRVSISGLSGADGRLRATRVTAADAAEAALLTGTISALDGTAFRLGEQAVEAAGAALEGLPDGLGEGLRVQVRGSLDGGLLQATRVSAAAGVADGLAEGDALRLEGRVAALEGSALLLDGVRVFTAGAALTPADQVLANGLIVEAAGSWNGEALVADTLTNRRGTLRLAGTLSAIDSAAGTLALQLPADSVTLATDRRTLVEDGRDNLPFPSLEDLRTGDYLAVEALRKGGQLLATRIDRGADKPARVLQAPVEAFAAPTTLTLLGITVAVDGARFQNAVDAAIDAATFFDNLSPGALVRTVDDDGDGRAEVVEFEFPLALDGELSFRAESTVPLAGDGALPSAILADLATRFPGLAIAGAWLVGESYEVALADGTRLFYSAEGILLTSSGPSADTDDGATDGDGEEPAPDGDEGSETPDGGDGEDTPDGGATGDDPDGDTSDTGDNGTGDDADSGALPPGQGGDIPGSPGDNPGSGGDIPGSPGDNPGSGGDIPGSPGDNPGSGGDIPGVPDDTPGKAGG